MALARHAEEPLLPDGEDHGAGAPLLDERVGGGPGELEGSAHVEVEHAVELFVLELAERALGVDAGAVDRGVEPPVGGEGGLHGRLGLAAHRQISDLGRDPHVLGAERAGERVEGRLVAPGAVGRRAEIDEVEGGALRGREPRDGRSHAAGRAGEEDYAISEQRGHVGARDSQRGRDAPEDGFSLNTLPAAWGIIAPVSGIPFGRYELLRKLAAGGMAEVFLAREWGEAGFFRELAIKRLFPHLVDHPPSLRSFQIEARLMGELCHPNIPQVYELGQFDGQWFVAMEYVDGHNIADLSRMSARAGYPIPLSVALGIVLQVAEGLHHAHERKDRAGRSIGFVHRDLTPHNIMVTADGVAKLMDFGVAQTNATLEERGAVRGTYAYMAPEQVRGMALDRRSDVFALGIILYELTTGTRLFTGTDVQIMTAVTERDAPPPSSRVSGYPQDLEAIVMAALARDPDHRIASAADLSLHLWNFAVRNGLLVGPRAIAHHVQLVAPRSRLLDEELGFVDPRISQPGIPISDFDPSSFSSEAPEDTGIRRSWIPAPSDEHLKSGVFSDAARAVLLEEDDEIDLADLLEDDGPPEWDDDPPRR